eukprot:209321-Chlamydomonas_euryale.AAC.5
MVAQALKQHHNKVVAPDHLRWLNLCLTDSTRYLPGDSSHRPNGPVFKNAAAVLHCDVLLTRTRAAPNNRPPNATMPARHHCADAADCSNRRPKSRGRRWHCCQQGRR